MVTKFTANFGSGLDFQYEPGAHDKSKPTVYASISTRTKSIQYSQQQLYFQLFSIIKNYFIYFRTSTSVDVKSCIIEKYTIFTHFTLKIFSTSVFLKMCKDVYIYTLATVTVYIYTVTVALLFIILIIYSLSLSLGFGHLTLLSLSSFDQIILYCHRSSFTCR